MKEENLSEIEKISLKIKENGIENIYLNFVDFKGNMRSKLVGVKELINNTHVSWNDGISINGKLIKDFENEHNADWLVLLPDSKSFRIIPFLDDDNKSGMIMCRIKNFSLDTRNLLEKAVSDIEKEISAQAIIGSELIYEYVDSEQDYYSSLPTSQSTKFNNILANYLLQTDIDVEYYMQYGKSHNRIDLVPDIANISADKLQISKWFLNSLAYKNNVEIKFSNLDNKIISSCPLHISLWDENKKNNLFFDENDELELSKLAKQFINGILYFHKYIYAICKITTNQEMLKLIPKASVERDDSLIMVPLYFKEKQKKDRIGWSKRIIFQGLNSDANHYLAISAILYAGLYGIKNNIDENLNYKLEYTNKELYDEIRNNKYFYEKFGIEVSNKIQRKLEEAINE